ncbi:hypothetical protein FHU33_2368 [Blastococcus colisei]|uniref:Uncharacterized protein n=1 Tax=Blastococcus colisei TaxID=1564162 RepID=A0A543PFU2_9ACTN|nr:hypothetical protein [Blastococcus colisei]TQN42949.1 hypothetical protein FHU33_2368 [Blastococcus colisei]
MATCGVAVPAPQVLDRRDAWTLIAARAVLLTCGLNVLTNPSVPGRGRVSVAPG